MWILSSPVGNGDWQVQGSLLYMNRKKQSDSTTSLHITKKKKGLFVSSVIVFPALCF